MLFFITAKQTIHKIHIKDATNYLIPCFDAYFPLTVLCLTWSGPRSLLAPISSGSCNAYSGLSSPRVGWGWVGGVSLYALMSRLCTGKRDIISCGAISPASFTPSSCMEGLRLALMIGGFAVHHWHLPPALHTGMTLMGARRLCPYMSHFQVALSPWWSVSAFTWPTIHITQVIRIHHLLE